MVASCIQPQDDLLTFLQSSLRRIDEELRDEDLTPNASELKRLLLRRIEIIEAVRGKPYCLKVKMPPPANEPGSAA